MTKTSCAFVCFLFLTVEIASKVGNCLPKNIIEPLTDSTSFTVGDEITLEIDQGAINVKITGKSGLPLSGMVKNEKAPKGVNTCRAVSDSVPCFQWENGPRLEIYDTNEGKRETANVQCQTFNLTVPQDTAGLTDTPETCYGMANYFWYGGFEEANQYWPMNNFQIGSTPFITSEGYSNDFGGVIEGIFLSSAGIGLYVHETSPLYISINDRNSSLLCIKGKVGADTPFFNYDKPFLTYDVCSSTDIASLWKGMAERFFPKPSSYPSEDIFRYPIWSTWAAFKENINQRVVLEYAQNIKKYNFSISQLEIDDNWTPRYGDFVFNPTTFPDARQLVTNLTSLGIPTTVWVHWFFNNDSDAFRELSKAGYLIQGIDNDQPILVPWWRGTYAGVLDVTNSNAVSWYLNKLINLTTNYNVTSFKFDAGEVKWVKNLRYKVKGDLPTPNFLTKKYSEATYKADTRQRRQELRVAYRSQATSHMVRMFDRNSNWDHNLGIKSLIPCALAFGLMGYPYVLPDYIGGNAYGGSDIDVTVMPEPELFVRWLQVTVFLPVLQFSIEPWAYNDTITAITQKFIRLHEVYADKIIELAKNAQSTGEPIVRPLWWLAPNDKDSLSIDTEFLLGDEILVAPVLEKGARTRDIYLPPGVWKDELRNVVTQGGIWLRNYPAALDELPFFVRN